MDLSKNTLHSRSYLNGYFLPLLNHQKLIETQCTNCHWTRFLARWIPTFISNPSEGFYWFPQPQKADKVDWVCSHKAFCYKVLRWLLLTDIQTFFFVLGRFEGNVDIIKFLFFSFSPFLLTIILVIQFDPRDMSLKNALPHISTLRQCESLA